MGFASVPQWVRHHAQVAQQASSITVTCSRCGIALPISVVPGTIVLTKEDRLHLGDDPRATDCHV